MNIISHSKSSPLNPLINLRLSGWKIISLEQGLSKKSDLQEKFSREIDELSQETEELVEEIDKWQI